ncbi:hypothetical protein PPERSA_12818 [Pseudocohnilembus persalinus]|uniref:YeeE/YedE family protein n=1 Tax=Pseudocohnilembus persalinus TaxID=266149 RepID=A0A0V0QEH9_PSEPJ|nr:hypothetical protein PPERSA_12818 [Pseudocohnilembus persalinus]|eukprot:KRX00599.1 hypothetical protein PPERSA_12818 [Pseudocohnilembus persalinus]
MSDQNQAIVGGLITASAISLHVLLNNRTISMSRNLYSLVGNELNLSRTRFPLILGALAAGAAIQLKNSGLFGGSNGSDLSIWGFLIAGLFIGLGTSFAGAGIETQMWSFLPNFDRWTIAAIVLTFLGAFGGASLAINKPDAVSFLFGTADTPKFDQSKSEVVLIVVLVIFALFLCYHFFNQRAQIREIIDMCISFLCGGLYALGLASSGLCDKTKVQAFFDWSGSFKGDVGVAMLVTLIANLLLVWLLNRYRNPDWEKMPTNDQYLYVGSLLFGFGWGFCGLAIGPIFIVSASLVSQVLLLVLPLMIIGFLIDRRNNW